MAGFQKQLKKIDLIPASVFMAAFLALHSCTVGILINFFSSKKHST